MPKRTTKKTSTSIFDFTEPKGPQTAKGKANKLMTGDGRKTVKNLTKEEAVDLANGLLWVDKRASKK